MRSSATRSLAGIGGAILVTAVTIGVWQWWATAYPVFFLPAPSTILERLGSDWFSASAWTGFLSPAALDAIGQTFFTALAGWGVAVAVGAIAGSLLGSLPWLRMLASMPLLLLRSVPAVAVIPICIVVFGLGAEMRIIAVAFGCLWPILLNTVAGVAEIEPLQLDVARMHRLTAVQRFCWVLLPAASPKIFAGMRVGMSLAIVISVGVELFAGTGGLGGLALGYQSTFDVPGLWATLVVLAIFGVLVNLVFMAIERVALRWHRQRSVL